MSFDDVGRVCFSPVLTFVPEFVQPSSFMTIPACSESWEMRAPLSECPGVVSFLFISLHLNAALRTCVGLFSELMRGSRSLVPVLEANASPFIHHCTTCK